MTCHARNPAIQPIEAGAFEKLAGKSAKAHFLRHRKGDSPLFERVKISRMSDSRRHRGPHPLDEELFSAGALPTLREAVRDLSWLRTRGYAERSAIKLVGDRYQLRRRQRVAVGRCACSDKAKRLRASRQRDAKEVHDRALAIDGLNAITTVEVALAGGAWPGSLHAGHGQLPRELPTGAGDRAGRCHLDRRD
ncbi:MAG: DUF434 domain-containing protein [Deltaproteobacteria bacterium]|nr:MAG: DUF434 domain-containing protein [Deltaproteobacteria bacterium]